MSDGAQVDWFSQNAPGSQAQDNQDWFASNQPKAATTPTATTPTPALPAYSQVSGVSAQPSQLPRWASEAASFPVNPMGLISHAYQQFAPAPVKELLTGGQSAGQPYGTKSGILNNPVTQALSMAAPSPNVPSQIASTIPSAKRAGQALNAIESAIGKEPINVTDVGDTALRAQEFSKTGARLPKVVSDFLKRATDPDKGPMTFSEGRDFMQNTGKLSVLERLRTSGSMKAYISEMASKLSASLAQTAIKNGRPDYLPAINEYARAMAMRALAGKAATYAGVAGAEEYIRKLWTK